MKESRYVKLAKTMLNVLMKTRVPLYMHRKSNHIYTVWQHLILLAFRQYEGKNYRRFVEWLHEGDINTVYQDDDRKIRLTQQYFWLIWGYPAYSEK